MDLIITLLWIILFCFIVLVVLHTIVYVNGCNYTREDKIKTAPSNVEKSKDCECKYYVDKSINLYLKVYDCNGCKNK